MATSAQTNEYTAERVAGRTRRPLLAHATGAADVIDVTSPAPRAEWRALLRADSHALAFQTPVWLDCVCEVDGYEDTSRLYELKGGGQLILPLVRRAGRTTALEPESSLPGGWGFGGVISAGPIGSGEVATVLADLARRSTLRTALRPNPLDHALWHAAAPPGVTRLPRMAHTLALEGGFARVWERRFVGTARTAVRKAERSGLVVECDTTGKLVPVFYDLYQRSVERWGQQEHEGGAIPVAARWRAPQPEPRRKLEVVARRLGEACQIWVAWRGGQPAAAIVVLRQGENASYWRGAMDKQLAGPTRANYLLHRLAIEDACRRGCRKYHMGETGESAPLAQFKSRFGAQAYHYFEYRVERFPITRTYNTLRLLVQRVCQVGRSALPPHNRSEVGSEVPRRAGHDGRDERG